MPRPESEGGLENNPKMVVRLTSITTRYYLNKQNPDSFEPQKAEKAQMKKIPGNHPSARTHHKQFADFDRLADELDCREEYDSYYKDPGLTFAAYKQDQATGK